MSYLIISGYHLGVGVVRGELSHYIWLSFRQYILGIQMLRALPFATNKTELIAFSYYDLVVTMF